MKGYRNITLCLPGDKPKNHSEIMVNHAGEYAAVKICEGQIAAYEGSDSNIVDNLQHTMKHELEHLQYFDNKINELAMRPTVFLPLWNTLSYALGYISGRAGVRGIMTCTYAIEREIAKHYTEQLGILEPGEFRDNVQQFYDDEVEHRDGAAKFMDHAGWGSRLSVMFISMSCRVAIELSKRV